MSPVQGKLVRESWGRIAHHGGEFANFFYARLFEADPTVHRLFPRDMFNQHRELMQFLELVVNGSRCLDELEGDIQVLGRRHLEYGVRPEHFPIMRAVLLATVKHMLGRSHTSEIENAWGAIYDHLARIMLRSGYSAEGTWPRR